MAVGLDPFARETIQNLVDEGHIDGLSIGEYSAAQMGRDISTADERLPSSRSLSTKNVNRQLRTQDPIFGTFSLPYTSPPDLKVFIDETETTCDRVCFSINLVPSTGISPSENQPVRVRVVDNVFGDPRAVAEALVLIPASGGSVPVTLGFPVPQDAYAGTGWSNDITVIVDPDNEIRERDEGNNEASIKGSC